MTTNNTPLNADDVYNAEAWKDGFQAGYDQVILEMLYWLSETKRKTIPAKWVTSRQRNFDDDRHMNYDSYRKKHELQAREKCIEDVKYAGYGYDDGTGFVLKISYKELAALKEHKEAK